MSPFGLNTFSQQGLSSHFQLSFSTFFALLMGLVGLLIDKAAITIGCRTS